METISELVGQELAWEQPSAFRQEYRLFHGEQAMAELNFQSSFHSIATGEWAGRAWTFRRTGFFHHRVLVGESDPEREVAVFEHHTWRGGGTLELPDGRGYPVSTNFWLTQLFFCDPADELLVQFHKIGGFLHLSAQVEVLPAARQLPEAPLMVLLGLYLIVMMQRDSAAASAAASA